MPLRTRRSLTLGTPRDLFGRNGLMAVHSKSVSSYLMIRGSFRELESRLSRRSQRRAFAVIGNPYPLILVPLIALAVFFMAWGRDRGRVEAFVGRLPAGNYCSK